MVIENHLHYRSAMKLIENPKNAGDVKEAVIELYYQQVFLDYLHQSYPEEPTWFEENYCSEMDTLSESIRNAMIKNGVGIESLVNIPREWVEKNFGNLTENS